jgi:hypothetical protein
MRRTVQRSELDRDDATRQLKRMYRSVAKEERDAIQLLHALTDTTTADSSKEYSHYQLVSPTTTTRARKPVFNSANSEYYAISDHGSTCSSCGSGSHSNGFFDSSAVVPVAQQQQHAQLKLLAKRCVQVEAQLRVTEHRCASVTQEGIAIAKALQQLQQATASTAADSSSGSGDHSTTGKSNSKQQQLEELKQLKNTQLQQLAYVARQQGLRVKCEAYKTTVLTQEQVIAKLEQALATATAATATTASASSNINSSSSSAQQLNSSRSLGDAAKLQRLRDENVTLKAALESLGNGSNEKAQVTELESVLQIRDDKLQILEDQMVQNARAAQAQITQLKLQIMELEMQGLRT